MAGDPPVLPCPTDSVRVRGVRVLQLVPRDAHPAGWAVRQGRSERDRDGVPQALCRGQEEHGP